MMATRGPIARAVADALKDAPLLPRDSAAVALVKRYAVMLDDDPETLDSIGPKLLAALTALGMTPAARGVKGAETGAGIAAKLDEFTARRTRKHAS